MASSSGSGVSSGSSGVAYSSGRGIGGASSAPIGRLGMVPGTAAYSAGWGGMGGALAGLPANTGDSRTFSALSPRSQAYMKAGSPGSYASWLQGGGGAGGGGGGGGGQGSGMSLEDLLAMMFAQRQQKRPDYSQLFMSPQMNLEGLTIMQPQAEPTQSTQQPTLSNIPRFYDTRGYI